MVENCNDNAAWVDSAGGVTELRKLPKAGACGRSEQLDGVRRVKELLRVTAEERGRGRRRGRAWRRVGVNVGEGRGRTSKGEEHCVVFTLAGASYSLPSPCAQWPRRLYAESENF